MTPELNALRTQIEAEIERYIDARHEKVSAFVNARFSLPAVFGVFRRHLRSDAWRLSLNFALALLTLLVRRGATLSEKLGFYGVQRALERFPLPLPTAYENDAARAIERELFGVGTDRTSPLLQALEGNEAVQNAINEQGTKAEFLKRDGWIKEEIRACIEKWTSVRAQVLGGAGSLTVLGVPYAFVRSGRVHMSEAAHQAARDFFLGESMGKFFYSVAPVKPTFAQGLLATLVTFLAIAAITLLVNFAADPLQRQFGSHQRQLHRALDELEERLGIALKRRLSRPKMNTDVRLETIEDLIERMGEGSRFVAKVAAERAEHARARALRVILGAARWTGRRFAAEAQSMQRTFGTATFWTTLTVIVCAEIGAGLYAYDFLQKRMTEEPRKLVAARAFGTAIMRIDAMLQDFRISDDLELRYLRAHSLCAVGQGDACARAYNEVLAKSPRYRSDPDTIRDLTTLLARTGHGLARRALIEWVGAPARKTLKHIALERRPLERWVVAETLTQLGGQNQPWREYIEIELSLAKQCDDRRRAVAALGAQGHLEAVPFLRAIIANPHEKCVHGAAADALLQLSP